MKRFLVFVVFAVLVTNGSAQISPGKLSKPHTTLEGMENCTKCHTLGGGPENKKCLGCHKEITEAVNAGSGYHFYVTKKQSKDCAECHMEHNGSNFKLIYWPSGMEKFDHIEAGYKLLGKHENQKCRQCHQPKNIKTDLKSLNTKIDLKNTFLGLDTPCLSCHANEHQGQLPTDCVQCHRFNGWKPAAKFTHEMAKFKLTGKHKTVDCAKCHKPVFDESRNQKKARVYTKFTGLKFRNCSACHTDIHRGQFGVNCTKCHSAGGWQRISQGAFNHSLTQFPLRGLHKQVACEKCHRGGDMKRKLRFANCTDCHRDAHFGQLADRKDSGRCESCHTVFGFVPAKFDVAEHGKTDFPLTGAHLAIPCIACHSEGKFAQGARGRMFDFAETTCKSCHEDVHKGQFAAQIRLGGCETCHQTSDWSDTKFDHSTSRFLLVGKHRQVQCRQCHKTIDAGTSSERILFKPIKTACRTCHKDPHVGQFKLIKPKKTCDKCHTPSAWESLTFDHNRDALFHLNGAHEKVPCAACHKVRKGNQTAFVLFRGLDRRCIGCHGNKK